MDFTRLKEFEEIFGHRWDALALLCLAEGPCRFNQLAATMGVAADERLADPTLSRSLRRLVGRRLVVKSDGASERYPIYALTPTGVRLSDRLAICLKAIEDDPDGDA